MHTVDKFFFVFANLVLAATAFIFISTASGAGDEMLPILFLPMAVGGLAFIPWVMYRACTGFRSCQMSLAIGLICFIGAFHSLFLLVLGLPISVIPVAVGGWIAMMRNDECTQ